MSHLSKRLSPVRLGGGIGIFTVLWMIVEASVSIGVGILATSALLVAFGLDSVIELISGAVLLWRLFLEAQGKQTEQVERAERSAAQVVALPLCPRHSNLGSSGAYSFGSISFGHQHGGGSRTRHASAGDEQTTHCGNHREWSFARGCCQFLHLWLHGWSGAARCRFKHPLALVVGRGCRLAHLSALVDWGNAGSFRGHRWQ